MVASGSRERVPVVPSATRPPPLAGRSGFAQPERLPHAPSSGTARASGRGRTTRPPPCHRRGGSQDKRWPSPSPPQGDRRMTVTRRQLLRAGALGAAGLAAPGLAPAADKAAGPKFRLGLVTYNIAAQWGLDDL